MRVRRILKLGLEAFTENALQVLAIPALITVGLIAFNIHELVGLTYICLLIVVGMGIQEDESKDPDKRPQD